MPRTDSLRDLLDGLLATSKGLLGVAVVTVDGLVLASVFPPHLAAEPVARAAASVLALGDEASRALAAGAIDRVLVHGEAAVVAVFPVTESVLLMAAIERGAKLGLSLLDLEEATRRLAERL